MKHKHLDDRSLEHIRRGRSDATDAEVRQATNDAVAHDSSTKNRLRVRPEMILNDFSGLCFIWLCPTNGEAQDVD